MTPRLPTFLIIGAQKSATRWLRHNLGRHPDVFAAPREIAFFNSDRYEEYGLEWYREQFCDAKGAPVIGEATPAYMMWRHDPELVSSRIATALPDVRLVAILRNPIDRAASAFVHHINNQRLPRDADLVSYVLDRRPEDDPLGIVTGGWYAASLAPFRRRFGDALLVLLNDDLSQAPRPVYDRAVEHIGAERGFVPPDLAKVRFSYQRNETAEHGRPLTLSERRLLWDRFFEGDVAELETMIGRDLVSWRPTRAVG